MPSPETQKNLQTPAGQLGTFGGVFTPSILTILGIILFLRLGFVVGQAGLLQALLIIALANAISVLTSISLAAIATNLRVKGGGYYYIISRTLGLEFGGALGVVLFLAQSVSIGFYCIGFGEAVCNLLPWSSPQLLAALAAAVLFFLAWLGADLATKFQYLVMAVLSAALLSFFLGGFLGWDSGLILQNLSRPESGLSFWVIFAVFFPAVTGFTQGVSMSGDLKDPARSLPLGTFAAVGISAAVYFAAAAFLAATVPGEVLRTDFSAMQNTALLGPLILAGVIAATLSSAMASFLGAPRILQALAGDRIFPLLQVFAQGSGTSHNPRKAVVLAAVLAFMTIALGRLNLIAPVVSMFFLISYGLLNYATYYEARTQSPSFRPRFRFYHPSASLLGALACLGAMLAINPAAGITALAILTAVYQYLKRTSRPTIWADSQRSYHLQQARSHLLAAAEEPEHPRHWRPQILAFSDDPRSRGRLLHFCSWIEGGSGLTTLVRILEGQGLASLKQKEQALKELAQDIRDHDLQAFPLVISSQDLPQGISVLLQAHGLGPLQANTVVLNWFSSLQSASSLQADPIQNLRSAFWLQDNIIILHASPQKWGQLQEKDPQQRQIDVWWWGGATSRLMLLLAYLCTRHADWSGASLRVLALCLDSDPEEQKEVLSSLLEDYRIQAESIVVLEPDSESLAEKSQEASLVFLPFSLETEQILDPFGKELNRLLNRLPLAALCLAAEDIALDAEPEHGEPAQAAAALKRLEERKQKLTQAEKALQETESAAEKAQAELQQARQEDLQELLQARDQTRSELVQAKRRLLKAQAQVEQAQKELKELDPALIPEEHANGQS